MRKIITKNVYNMFTNKAQVKKVIQQTANKTILNFANLEQQNSQMQAAVIMNNLLNQQWLEKGLRVCQNVVVADGGANVLYDSKFRNSDKVRWIVGDFDSIRDQVKQFYTQRQVYFQKYPNQNISDFSKAFQKSIQQNWTKILCYGAFGGRMDHTLAAMSSTAKYCRKYKQLQNLMYYLRPNTKYEIKMSNQIQRKGCGIVRFGDKVKLRTNGFKWNLGENCQYSELEWGTFISTSNQIISDTVEIQAEGEVYFVASLKTKYN